MAIACRGLPLCFWVLLATQALPTYAGLLAHRISSDSQTKGLAAQLGQAGKKAIELLDDSDEMPSIDQFCQVVDSLEVQFQPMEWNYLWMVFASAQRPEVTSENLSQRIQANLQSLTTLDTNYRVISDDIKTSKSPDSEISCRLVYTGSKVLYSQENLTPVKTGRPTREVDTYDGNIHRSYKEFVGLSGNSKVVKRGTIQLLDSIGQFYSKDSPIAKAMLLDTKVRFDRPMEQSDLSLALQQTTLLETQEEFLGRQCIVVGIPGRKYFLDPSRGYACVGQQHGGYSYNSELRKHVADDSTYLVQENRSFVEVEDNVWLPESITTTYFASGTPIRSEIVRVSSFKANDIIDSSVFTDIFPTGLTIVDMVRNASYIQGSDESIESTLKSVTPISSSSRSFIIVLNIVAIIVIALLVVRRRLQSTK